jgi:chromate transporter
LDERSQFADSFAISQVSPGPNIIIVTLIGYHVAGLAGAAVATAAMCGPRAFSAFLVARHLGSFQGGALAYAIQMPVWFQYRSGVDCRQRFSCCAERRSHTFISLRLQRITAMVGFATRINPLLDFAVGGALGLSAAGL